MTPSHLAVTSPNSESESPLPEGSSPSFGILSGTQEADSRTKPPGEPAAEPAQPPSAGQLGEPTVASRGGRPRRIDHEKREKILAMLENGFSQPICAAHVGVSLRTLRREMARDPEFRERVMRAETLFEQWPLTTIIKAARTSWRAASWLIANTPHVSVRRRKRKEKEDETKKGEKIEKMQPSANDDGSDAVIAMLAQPFKYNACTPGSSRGK
jgi:hypothetical protein